MFCICNIKASVVTTHGVSAIKQLNTIVTTMCRADMRLDISFVRDFLRVWRVIKLPSFSIGVQCAELA